ncbi:MAG: protein kinase [Candidatus Eisenbacteria bacterium]|nr:protein kinase [Candidatus Eisenbacteria bacterium]
MSDTESDIARAVGERYRIDRVLGRGGMATVYLAQDLKHGRPVAIKVMDPRIGAAIGAHRFLREIEIAARLNHPHILPLFDSGAAGEQLYYVMPYIAGESLRARLERESRLPVKEAVRLARDVAGALAHAHARGLVHRDIKPENVLLAEGIAQVADFGIARTRSVDGVPGEPGREDQAPPPVLSSSLPGDKLSTDATRVIHSDGASETFDPTAVMSTRVGAIIGTPRYMAPEQAQGRTDLDGRADQYALGCVLYELLTGRAPFESNTFDELMRQHAQEEASVPSSMRPDVTEALDRAVSRAMAKSPEDRFSDITEFSNALAVAVGGAQEAPPDTQVPSNLPRERTRFIGRTRETSACLRLLAQCRLLTLTGIGGGGKTRLALEVARRAVERFPDGVWYVDLASLDDPERVAQNIVMALALPGDPETSSLSQLETYLAGRYALLVVNNCEHLRAAVGGIVAHLLRRAPGLTILATSRASLAVEGEQLYPVGSLSMPEAGEVRREVIAGAEAVRLFVDRARLSDPNFELTAQSAPVVAEVCRRLDGIPLALELAVARLRVLSLPELCARLDDRFRLLTGGSMAALPRHQTLRGAIGWSYEQLEDGEQRLLRGLGAFRGGCTLEGAVRVAQANLAGAETDGSAGETPASGGVDEFEVLDRLGRLADSSLVVLRRVEDGSSRYDLLETVREFASEQLNAAGEFVAVAAAHLEHVRAISAEWTRKVHQADAGASRRAIDREIENVVAALSRADGLPQGARASLETVAALRLYWVNSGQAGLGVRLVEEALERAKSLGPIWPRAQALQTKATLAFYQGRIEDARSAMEEALSISRRLDKWLGVAAGLSMLGTLAERDGNLVQARAHMNEAVELFRQHGDEMRLGSMLSSLASLSDEEGDTAQASALFDESARLSEKVGNWDGVSTARLNLGRLALRAGDDSAALTSLRAGLALARQISSVRHLAAAFDLSAVVAMRREDASTAARFMEVSEQMRLGAHLADELRHFKPLMVARAWMAERLTSEARAECAAAVRAMAPEAAQLELADWLARQTEAS